MNRDETEVPKLRRSRPLVVWVHGTDCFTFSKQSIEISNCDSLQNANATVLHDAIDRMYRKQTLLFENITTNLHANLRFCTSVDITRDELLQIKAR
jgi:hypothetical protein